MQCLINMLKSQFILSTNNIGHSVAEYIQYETQDVANGYEIENFCTQVDELKSRTELLAKRIQLLRSCLESSNLLQKELN